VFIVIGLLAPNAQAAQGMSMIAFVLAFISSTYVPPSSMPGWLQPFAKYQPVTPMVNAVRSALTGGTHDLNRPHLVGRPDHRLRPHRCHLLPPRIRYVLAHAKAGDMSPEA
jgi:hypothetical protein